MKASATTCAWSLAAALCAAAAPAASADTLPVTPAQRATAQQVAHRGVPLDALSPNAPDSYTVRSGDTLWHIAGLFLRQPQRWPQLWGMNLQTIRNPHLIFPGQVLYLDRSNGYAHLSTRPGSDETVRLSPRMRSDSLSDQGIPALPMHLIEPFMTEPLVIDSNTLEHAPRLVATSDDRVLIGHGDTIYARGPAGAPLVRDTAATVKQRIFRQATPLYDPVTRELLGYEAHFLGRAELLRDESQTMADHVQAPATVVPATLAVTQAKEEIQPGDRLLPEPPRQFANFVPHAPQQPVDARVVSLYTSTAMRYGTQHQVVAINRGTNDGMDPGMVLTLVSAGQRMIDKTDAQRDTIHLPDEVNGTAIVFRTFERVSYVLLMDIQRGVQVGDKLIQPH